MIHLDPQITRARKQELAFCNEAWIKAMLHHGASRSIVTIAGAQPFLTTRYNVFDESKHCIYFHRNPVGCTRANLEVNPQVCCQVVEMGRMCSGKNTLDFGVKYRSVVIFGTARRVGWQESAHALHLLMQKYAPHLEFVLDYAAFEPQCPDAASVHPASIAQWSKNKSEVSQDHRGISDYLEKRQVQA